MNNRSDNINSLCELLDDFPKNGLSRREDFLWRAGIFGLLTLCSVVAAKVYIILGGLSVILYLTTTILYCVQAWSEAVPDEKDQDAMAIELNSFLADNPHLSQKFRPIVQEMVNGKLTDYFVERLTNALKALQGETDVVFQLCTKEKAVDAQEELLARVLRDDDVTEDTVCLNTTENILEYSKTESTKDNDTLASLRG